jgi:hypothetical protein
MKSTEQAVTSSGAHRSLTVSLPEEDYLFVIQHAATEERTRSQIISRLIRQARAEEEDHAQR